MSAMTSGHGEPTGPRTEWSTRYVDSLRQRGKQLRVYINGTLMLDNPDSLAIRPGMVVHTFEGATRTLTIGEGVQIEVKEAPDPESVLMQAQLSVEEKGEAEFRLGDIQ